MLKMPCGGFLMIVEAIFLALLTLFAVFGFYSAGRLVISRYTQSCCRVAVTLGSGDDIELLRLKLGEVKSQFFCRRHSIIVLIPNSRVGDFAITEMLDGMGVEYLFFNEEINAGR